MPEGWQAGKLMPWLLAELEDRDQGDLISSSTSSVEQANEMTLRHVTVGPAPPLNFFIFLYLYVLFAWV